MARDSINATSKFKYVDPNVIESELSVKLFRLLNAYNLMEQNIEYCLRYLLNPKHPESAHSKLSKFSGYQKVELLSSELERIHGIDKPKLLDDYRAWLDTFNDTREVRNRFIHSVWEILPLCGEKPIRSTPMVSTELPTISMSIDDFESVRAEVQTVFDRFMKFRQKYFI